MLGVSFIFLALTVALPSSHAYPATYDHGISFVSAQPRAENNEAARCKDGTWALTIPNYNESSTDRNLKTWWFGGTDTDGFKFNGKVAHLCLVSVA